MTGRSTITKSLRIDPETWADFTMACKRAGQAPNAKLSSLVRRVAIEERRAREGGK